MRPVNIKHGEFVIYSDSTAPKYLPTGDMVGWVVGLFVRRMSDAKPVIRFVHFLTNKHQELAVQKAKEWIDANPDARLKTSRALTLQELVFETAVAFEEALGKGKKKPAPAPVAEEEPVGDPLKGPAAWKRNVANFEKGGPPKKKAKAAKPARTATNSLPDDGEDF